MGSQVLGHTEPSLAGNLERTERYCVRSSTGGVQVFVENVHFLPEKVNYCTLQPSGDPGGEWGGGEVELKAFFSFSC